MIASRFFIVIIFLLSVAYSSAMIYDNRFLPEFKLPFSRTCEHQSRFYLAPTFMLAHKAYADDIDDEVGIYDIFGTYNENNLRRAIIRIGGPDFFDTPALMNFKDKDVPWRMHGKIDAQGFIMCYDQHLWGHWSSGLSATFMHLFARNNFTLIPADVTLTVDDALALDEARRAMDQYLLLKPPVWEKVGLGDIEWYIRFGSVWEYMFKLRRIDLGGRFGVLMPTGVKRNSLNPASIPFGGNGFWGIYVAGDFELEVREDWLVGGFLQLNQRFSRNETLRLPVADEQLLYGALAGSLLVQPDPTLILSLYAKLEGVRDGLGFRAQYTGVFHGEDSFIDRRSDQKIPLTLTKMFDRSSWQSEYITLDGFYDFNKIWQECSYMPVVNLMIDIPIKFFFAERVSKTNRVSLGIQFTY